MHHVQVLERRILLAAGKLDPSFAGDGVYSDIVGAAKAIAVQPDGLRTLQPLPDVAAWCRCFDLIQVNENEMSRGFLAFPRIEFLGLTLLTWLAVVLVIAFVLLLRGSRLARDLYAAGGNPHAAGFSGIDAGRVAATAPAACSGAPRRARRSRSSSTAKPPRTWNAARTAA